jgi:phage terminase small subunit
MSTSRSKGHDGRGLVALPAGRRHARRLGAAPQRSWALAKNPLHQVVRDNADHIRLLARELDLSPAARASLQMLPGADLPDIDAELGPPPRLRVVGDG